MSSANKISNKLQENTFIWVLLSLFVFIFLFFCSKTSPLYPTNDWADTNVYYNVAKAMLSGKTLYTEVFDHKGPLIFFIYGLAAFISSSSYIGLFFILFVLWTLFAWSIFATCNLFINKISSFISTLITIYFCLSYLWMGGSAEEFILLAEGISLYFFVRFFKQDTNIHNPKIMLIHGVGVSCVFFIKLSLILFWFFPILLIFGKLLFKKQYRNIFLNLAYFLLGFAIIALPILLYFLINGSLQEAYHVYIELNKQYSTSSDYVYLFTHGCSKLYTNIRDNLSLSVLYLLGIFYFPFRFIQNKCALSLTLSGVSLISMIFYNLTFHFYYPLVLLVFTALGLIVVFSFFRNILSDSKEKKYFIGVLVILSIVCIGKTNFFSMGTEELLRTATPSSPEFKFKHYLTESENSTLLNLSFGSGNALFTTAKKTPTVKYFFSPNIYYDMYPDIRDQQTKYIENKEIDFIISSTEGFNYDYFSTLDILHRNYVIIDSTKWANATYYLYKKYKTE